MAVQGQGQQNRGRWVLIGILTVAGLLVLAMIGYALVGDRQLGAKIVALENAGYVKAADVPKGPDLSVYAKNVDLGVYAKMSDLTDLRSEVDTITEMVAALNGDIASVKATITDTAGTSQVVASGTTTTTTTASLLTATSATTSTWPAGWPKSPEEFVTLVTTGQPTSNGTWLPIEVAEVSHPVGEPFAWRVAREKNLEAVIVPFWIHNPTKDIQDGWMHDPVDRKAKGRTSPVTAVGSGIPAGWSGLAEGATFRP